MTTITEQLNAIIHSLNNLQHADRTWMDSDQAQCIATLMLAVADLVQIVGDQQRQIKAHDRKIIELFRRALAIQIQGDMEDA